MSTIQKFKQETSFQRRMAEGHRNRKGHKLTGYYVPTGDWIAVRLVRECCGETE